MIEYLNTILNKITEKNHLIRITGALGVLGAFFIWITDFKLLYMPLSVKEYSIFRAAMSQNRADVLLYCSMAVWATPLVLLGLYHLYLTLSISNKLLARIAVGAYAFGYVNAALYYAFLAYIMSTAQLVVPLKLDLPKMTKHIFFIFQSQYYTGIIAGSILFFIGIGFFKKKNYPSWYIYFNPLYMIFVLRLILPVATPPVISGFLITASFNFIMLITFIFSTILMWNKSFDDLMPVEVKLQR